MKASDEDAAASSFFGSSLTGAVSSGHEPVEYGAIAGFNGPGSSMEYLFFQAPWYISHSELWEKPWKPCRCCIVALSESKKLGSAFFLIRKSMTSIRLLSQALK